MGRNIQPRKDENNLIYVLKFICGLLRDKFSEVDKEFFGQLTIECILIPENQFSVIHKNLLENIKKYSKYGLFYRYKGDKDSKFNQDFNEVCCELMSLYDNCVNVSKSW